MNKKSAGIIVVTLVIAGIGLYLYSTNKITAVPEQSTEYITVAVDPRDGLQRMPLVNGTAQVVGPSDTITIASTDTSSRNPKYSISGPGGTIGEVEGLEIYQPTFSPAGSKMLLRSANVCGAGCLDFNAYIVDISGSAIAAIKAPRKASDYAGPQEGSGIKPYSTGYEFKSETKLELTFFFVLEEGGTSYRISEKEVWSYDTTTRQYTFVRTIEE